MGGRRERVGEERRVVIVVVEKKEENTSDSMESESNKLISTT